MLEKLLNWKFFLSQNSEEKKREEIFLGLLGKSVFASQNCPIEQQFKEPQSHLRTRNPEQTPGTDAAIQWCLQGPGLLFCCTLLNKRCQLPGDEFHSALQTCSFPSRGIVQGMQNLSSQLPVGFYLDFIGQNCKRIWVDRCLGMRENSLETAVV